MQANGGMIPAPTATSRVHEIARDYEVPLIVDEVQSALCRCGPMFGSERVGLEPEMIVLGKALGGGLPLSATIATDDYAALLPWEYGFTQAGNPVACAAGGDARGHGSRRPPWQLGADGGVLLDRLTAMEQGSGLIGDIRGQGLMVGMELVRDRTTKEHALARPTC